MARTGRNGNRMYVVDCETGKVIDEYKNVQEAADDLGTTPWVIRKRAEMAFHERHYDDYICYEDDYLRRKTSSGVEILKRFSHMNKPNVVMLDHKEVNDVLEYIAELSLMISYACEELDGKEDMNCEQWKCILERKIIKYEHVK